MKFFQTNPRYLLNLFDFLSDACDLNRFFSKFCIFRRKLHLVKNTAQGTVNTGVIKMFVPYGGGSYPPYGGYYPGFPPVAAFYGVYRDPSDSFLGLPEETQLDLLRRGADSDEEMWKRLDELREKE